MKDWSISARLAASTKAARAHVEHQNLLASVYGVRGGIQPAAAGAAAPESSSPTASAPEQQPAAPASSSPASSAPEQQRRRQIHHEEQAHQNINITNISINVVVDQQHQRSRTNTI